MKVFTIVIGLLNQRAQKALETWPTPVQIYTRIDCLKVSRNFSFATKAFASMHKNPVIQSDMCRLMLLCQFGGMYIDTDVSFRAPFENTIDKDELSVVRDSLSELLAGTDVIGVSRPNQPCVCNAAKRAAKNVYALKGKLDFKTRPHLVHEVAGPFLFTKYVKDCVSPPYFDPSLNVYHAQASAAWANDKSYFSWTLERMKQAGWSTMFEH